MISMELDNEDKKILRELDSNSRSTLSEIGKKLRMSKSAVANRIRKMEESKVILGYYTLIDSTKLGYTSFRVYMKFQKINPLAEDSIINTLAAEPGVWWLGRIQGQWNLGFVIWVTNAQDFRNFWIAFLKKYRKYVGDYVVSFYSKLNHYYADYLVESRVKPARPCDTIGGTTTEKIDRKDRKILSLIATNARMPTVEIARKTGLTASIVGYRMRQLAKKSVIKSFRTIINNPLLGYSMYKADFILEDMTKLREMRSFVEAFPNLVYIDETVGGGDLESNFYCRNEQEFEEIINRLKKAFGEIIREYSYFVYSKVLKYAYFPENVEINPGRP